MPTQQINSNDAKETLYAWLSENLTIEKSIIPIVTNLKNVKKSKGIYFWFLHLDGYAKLSKYLNFTSVNPVYSLPIDGNKYNLVYLGTAGTGKKGDSDLPERLKWHINDKHTTTSICHGTLSTLRAGLSSLLAEDLIIPNSEILVNMFMENYMRVCWIEYDSIQEAQINSDEKNLIQILKPSLNIKNNPNAKLNATDNPTKAYRIRRLKIYSATQARLECRKEDSKQIMHFKIPPNNIQSSYNMQIINENEKCIEFTVSLEQSIAEVVRDIKGLPIGKCQILCYDSSNPDHLVYPSRNNDGWRVTGSSSSPNSQNIYTFFANVDPKLNNRKRWEIIQNEMRRDNISEITVRVCSDKFLEKAANKPIKEVANITSNEKVRKLITTLDFTNLKDKQQNKLLILACSNSKLLGGGENRENNYFNQHFPNIELIQRREERSILYSELLESYPEYFNKKRRGGTIVGVDYFVDQFQNPKFMRAIDRYNGKPYNLYNNRELILDRIKKSKLHVLILSGLYGVLKYDDSITDYQLGITKKASIWQGNLSIKTAVKNYILVNQIQNRNVYYSLSSTYKSVLHPNEKWTNLWINHGQGHLSAKVISKIFLANI